MSSLDPIVSLVIDVEIRNLILYQTVSVGNAGHWALGTWHLALGANTRDSNPTSERPSCFGHSRQIAFVYGLSPVLQPSL